MRKKLLFSIGKDEFEFQTFRAGGPGGQHQNKRSTGVRVVHKNSGARGESRSHRSQRENRLAALRRLIDTDRFLDWVRVEATRRELDREEIDRVVDAMMRPWNLRFEVVNEEGEWVEDGQPYHNGGA